MRVDPQGAKVLLCLQPTDMRKSFDTLAALIQESLRHDPFSGQCFVFRNKAGNRIKILAWDGSGLTLYYKRLESGQFVWPALNAKGHFVMHAIQLQALLEGMDWRRIQNTEVTKPTVAA